MCIHLVAQNQFPLPTNSTYIKKITTVGSSSLHVLNCFVCLSYQVTYRSRYNMLSKHPIIYPIFCINPRKTRTMAGRQGVVGWKEEREIGGAWGDKFNGVAKEVWGKHAAIEIFISAGMHACLLMCAFGCCCCACVRGMPLPLCIAAMLCACCCWSACVCGCAVAATFSGKTAMHFFFLCWTIHDHYTTELFLEQKPRELSLSSHVVKWSMIFSKLNNSSDFLT